MRKVLILVVFLIVGSLYSQDLDKMMTKKLVDCQTISYNSSIYFVKLVEENKIDSAKILLKYWEDKCGVREPLIRARVILALKEGNFKDSLLGINPFNNIFNYQNRADMIKYSNTYRYDNYESYFGYVPPGYEFDNFTRKEAQNLKDKYSPNSLEYLICEFYSTNSDTLFDKLQTLPDKNSLLASEYQKMVGYYLNLPEGHLEWITGIWIPTGGIKLLGIHPEMGFQAGVKVNKMSYDFTMCFKFVKSANTYLANRPHSDLPLESTSQFFGGYIGIDIGRDIFSKNGHEIQLTGGVAADGFDVLNENKDYDLKAASVWSYNFNLGLGYRYYLNSKYYVGVRAKYNVVDYKLNNIIDFSGNPITMHFVFGGVGNIYRDQNLKNLKYKLRR
ncbi:MAG: hypothetical protein WCR42_15230 [bacterium]